MRRANLRITNDLLRDLEGEGLLSPDELRAALRLPEDVRIVLRNGNSSFCNDETLPTLEGDGLPEAFECEPVSIPKLIRLRFVSTDGKARCLGFEWN